MNEAEIFALAGAGFAYDSALVLAGLDFSLRPGLFYGVVGPNGSGKTTLLDLLAGCKRPSAGQVSYLGQPVAAYRRRELARQIALVPQDFAVDFAFTVEEVVMMGRHPHIRRFAGPTAQDWRLVDEAMQTIGIDHCRYRQVNELSGGEKQRVVLARALAQDTPVLLLDEATSSLDVQHTLQIFNVARLLVRREQRTVIAVIHNLNLAAAYCDEILFMKDGRMVHSGATERIMEPGIIKEVFGVESEVRLDPFNNVRQVSYRYWSEG
ncbi:MAG: iron ABC transporter [Desulfobulbaceae bacterium DB1]|nr:MAG: iron ABC transporter [Desulfobulbaceae bacterium DB1]